MLTQKDSRKTIMDLIAVHKRLVKNKLDNIEMIKNNQNKKDKYIKEGNEKVKPYRI